MTIIFIRSLVLLAATHTLANKELMTRRALSTLLLIIFPVAPIFSPVAAQGNTRASERPNVVLILMDDLGYGDIGSFGVKDAKTPYIDRLARDGVRLTDAYANGPTCSPTIAGFITGQRSEEHGIDWQLGAVEGDVDRGLRVKIGR